MKTITAKEFKKLEAIELAGRKYAYSLQNMMWCESIGLEKIRERWEKYCGQLGIIDDGFKVKYATECGKDYSQGYYFGDALA